MGTQAQEYTTAGTYSFTMPAGGCVFATAIAGGAAGGSTDIGGGLSSLQSAAGGGAGESCNNIPVFGAPGSSMTVIVGAGGQPAGFNVLAINVHSGPPGSNSFNAGFGGEDTIIGDKIRLVGGYGGLQNGNAPHSGMGGGWRAFKGPSKNSSTGDWADNFGGSGNGVPGNCCVSPDSPCHFAGAGGGTGALKNGTPAAHGGDGGPCGPFLGGQSPVSATNLNTGGGGAASSYGPGGAGGDGSDTSAANAPGVPAGSYGAAGGGSGGTNSTSIPGLRKYAGAAGHDGYVLLTWYAP